MDTEEPAKPQPAFVQKPAKQAAVYDQRPDRNARKDNTKLNFYSSVRQPSPKRPIEEEDNERSSFQHRNKHQIWDHKNNETPFSKDPTMKLMATQPQHDGRVYTVFMVILS